MRRRRQPKFLSDAGGAVSIEFALLAPAVLLLIFMILEITLMSAAQSVLDKTVMLAAREIRTNQPSAQSDAVAARVRELACADVRLMDCAGKLQVQILSFPALADMATPDPFEPESYLPSNDRTDTGGPGSYVVMRLYYPWKFTMPGLAAVISSGDGSNVYAEGVVSTLPVQNGVLLSAGSAFRREP